LSELTGKLRHESPQGGYFVFLDTDPNHQGSIYLLGSVLHPIGANHLARLSVAVRELKYLVTYSIAFPTRHNRAVVVIQGQQ
jgi:hypothetical protein